MKQSLLDRDTGTRPAGRGEGLGPGRRSLPIWRVAGASERVLTLFVLVAAVGGVIVRLWQINSVGFNSDEAVYASQAAAIAGDAALKPFFPMFRAHPLLFQFVVSLGFLGGVSDLVARLLSAAFGLATVYLTYRIGSTLYGRSAGVFAAVALAFMPYHVIVTRQMILDGPMTFCATLGLYLVARFASSEEPEWLYAAGAAMGLTFLAKETGIILIGAICAFLALSPVIRLRIRDLVISLACVAAVVALFPLAITLAGGDGSGKTQSYLMWQLLRTPNHSWTFYPTQVLPAIGPLVLAAALLGFWLLRRERSWREVLLLVWILVPMAFFQLWPVKGFQYLLPAAPAIAVLAGRTLARYTLVTDVAVRRRRLYIPWTAVLAGVLALSLIVPSWQRVQAAPAGPVLAGAGGVPGGREAGYWIAANMPEGAQLLTIGPSMANILQFYGHRQARGLSVSPNPLRRNPSYQPVINPDLQLRNGEFQYLVYDAYSAARSDYFARSLLTYVRRYHGRVVHEESVPVTTPGGTTVMQPIIIIYEVRP